MRSDCHAMKQIAGLWYFCNREDGHKGDHRAFTNVVWRKSRPKRKVGRTR